MKSRCFQGSSTALAMFLIPILLLGCSAATEESDPAGAAAASRTLAADALAADTEHAYVEFPAGSFHVPAGTERFFCYTKTLEEDLVVDRFVYDSQPVVHHLVMAETQGEPEGFSECDVLFRPNWLPIFIGGAGDSVVDLPTGAGFKLEKGAQILIQLHLLNAISADVDDEVSVHVRKDADGAADDVGMVAFGSMAVALPPKAKSEVVGACEVDEDVDVFAMFPHMHYLGTSLTFEVGPSEDSLVEVFRRDPWDFDYQSIEPFKLSLSAGDHVRVTCSYDNPRDETVTFGESTLDEMCFLIAYVTGASQHIGGCLGGSSVDVGSFLPDGCGQDAPNDAGIGAECTADGGECGDELSCTHDLIGASLPGFCLSMNQCEASSDCGGGGALCCKSSYVGDINFCLPESCLFPGCEVL